MIHPDRVLAGLTAHGATLLTGVPCSFLTPLIDRALSEPAVRYIGATSEGEAAGIALGTWLAGGTPVALCQNSGLGNMVNPLTSLAFPCRAPVLVLSTWRGQPGLADEPQHELMGRVTEDLLGLMDIECARLPADDAEFDAVLDLAFESMAARSLPFCLVVEKGRLLDVGLHQPEVKRRPRGTLLELPRGERPRRIDVLERVLDVIDDEVLVVATTGKTGRELFTLADRPQHFYQVGAMGCASAVALGVALSSPRRVVVLDGDGAALMKLGNMATIGLEAPGNLVHVLLDNGVHDSTGGQRTAAGAISFPEIAIACGYRGVLSCDGVDDFELALRAALAEPGPQLVHARILPGSMSALGRPTLHPSEVARRFRDFASATADEDDAADLPRTAAGALV